MKKGDHRRPVSPSADLKKGQNSLTEANKNLQKANQDLQNANKNLNDATNSLKKVQSGPSSQTLLVLQTALTELSSSEGEIRARVQDLVNRGYKAKEWGKNVDVIVEQVVKHGHNIRMTKGDKHKQIQPTPRLRNAQEAVRQAEENARLENAAPEQKTAESLQIQGEQAVRTQVRDLLERGYTISDDKLGRNVEAIAEQIIKYGHRINFKKGDKSVVVSTPPELEAAKVARMAPEEAVKMGGSAQKRMDWTSLETRRKIQSLIDEGYKAKEWGDDVDKIHEQIFKYGHRINLKKGDKSEVVERLQWFKDALADKGRAQEALDLASLPQADRKVALQVAGEVGLLRSQIESLFRQGYTIDDQKHQNDTQWVLDQIIKYGHRINFKKEGKSPVVVEKSLNLRTAERNAVPLEQACEGLQTAMIRLSSAEQALKGEIENLLERGWRIKDYELKEKGSDAILEQILRGEEICFKQRNENDQFKPHKIVLKITPEIKEARAALAESQEAHTTASIRHSSSPSLQTAHFSLNKEVESLRMEIERLHRKGFNCKDQAISGKTELILEQMTRWGHSIRFKNGEGEHIDLRPSEALRRSFCDVFHETIESRHASDSQNDPAAMRNFNATLEPIKGRISRLIEEKGYKPASCKGSIYTINYYIEESIKILLREGSITLERNTGEEAGTTVTVDATHELWGAMGDVIRAGR